ncbi:MAG: MBL fold metallo-hydrolase, partial [Cyanobacteriota bacterium]|nr:MBL fold metallo-hydrolase [Cyanobacteriota bacterium]
MSVIVATEVALLPMLKDNYVFVLHNGKQAVVIDPALAEPTAHWLQSQKLELMAILHTHHHSDHIGGTASLLQHWPHCRVYAARADQERIPFQTHGVGDGDMITLLGRLVRVL